MKTLKSNCHQLSIATLVALASCVCAEIGFSACAPLCTKAGNGDYLWGPTTTSGFWKLESPQNATLTNCHRVFIHNDGEPCTGQGNSEQWKLKRVTGEMTAVCGPNSDIYSIITAAENVLPFTPEQEDDISCYSECDTTCMEE